MIIIYVNIYITYLYVSIQNIFLFLYILSLYSSINKPIDLKFSFYISLYNFNYYSGFYV